MHVLVAPDAYEQTVSEHARECGRCCSTRLSSDIRYGRRSKTCAAVTCCASSQPHGDGEHIAQYAAKRAKEVYPTNVIDLCR
jgi:hypothetical protein